VLINIFENEFVSCQLDDSLPLLRHRWLQEPPGEEFKYNLRRIQEEYIQLKKSYANLAWMADTELLGELDEDVETWLVNVWEDLLFNKAGVRIHAVILGASIFADYPMEKFKSDAEEKFKSKDIHMGVFSNEKEAYDWIKQKQQLTK
jgi:hypothetical protein